MLSKEYKEEALRTLENLTPEELIQSLKEIGSTWVPEKKKKLGKNDNNAYDFDFSNDAKGKDKGEHVA